MLFRCVLPLRPLFLECGTPYRASSTAYGGPPSPKGKVMGVIPFIRTGCICNVAGGRLPPLHAVGGRYLSSARVIFATPPGTAYRPFPTVSLVGGFFTQRILKNGHVRHPITVNCQLKTIVNYPPSRVFLPLWEGFFCVNFKCYTNINRFFLHLLYGKNATFR